MDDIVSSFISAFKEETIPKISKYQTLVYFKTVTFETFIEEVNFGLSDSQYQLMAETQPSRIIAEPAYYFTLLKDGKRHKLFILENNVNLQFYEIDW